MRFAIVAIARKGGPTLVQQVCTVTHKVPFRSDILLQVCTFVRSCHAGEALALRLHYSHML